MQFICEDTMEKMLLKMARQLNAMDEASLMGLWNKYLQRVQDFDASREWEESAIVLSLLQAVRGKNQLFNTKWAERQAESSRPSERSPEEMRPWRRMPSRTDGGSDEKAEAHVQHAVVHQFRPKRGS